MNAVDYTLHPDDEPRSGAATIHVAAACDETYAMPLAVMLRSLADHLGPGHTVIAHVLFEALSGAAKARIQASVPADRLHIHWIPVGNTGLVLTTAPIRRYDHVSSVSYFRLLLPEVLPQELDRVIYLDCDLVVLADITLMWQLELEDVYVAATPELTADSRRVSSAQGLRLWRELGLAADLEQFNSGVLLINLTKWRADYVKQRALVYLARTAEWLRWHDQEALNAVFAGNWRHLDARWNLTMRHLMNALPIRCEPFCIVHYHTAAKPWHADYPFVLQEVFFEYLDRTAWSGWRPQRSHFVAVRRFGKGVVKALRKRQHALQRMCFERSSRLQCARLFSTRPQPQGNPLPKHNDPDELRIFMLADTCTRQARTLIGRYLSRGGDRILLVLPTGMIDAWRSFAHSEARVHLIDKGDRSDDEIVRLLLHHYGQGRWCLLARSDEWLRFPYDDCLTLCELTRSLDAQQCTAFLSQRVDLLDAHHPALERASPDDLLPCGEFRLRRENLRKLPLTERDRIRNRVFVAESLVRPDQLDAALDSAYRCVVSLLRYTPDLLIAPGARSVYGARLATSEGVTLRIPAQGATHDLWQSGRYADLSWHELEAAGLLRASAALERLTADAPPRA